MPEKGEYVRFKNYERKTKSPLFCYADFESISVPEENGKQNSDEFYKNKYQKKFVCSYGHKLVCVNHKFSSSFKSYLDEDAVYNFLIT